MRNKSLVTLNPAGELLQHELHIQSGKYKPDNPFDRAFVPYLIMLFCAAVDASIFLSLFQLLSFDSTLILLTQVAGFVFAFDVVPIFIGTELKRVKECISKDRFILVLALSVCILAFITNVVLRVLTIDLLTPDVAGVASGFGAAAPVAEAPSGPSDTALGLTWFGIVLPALTSIGSFFISYLTYKPMQIRKQRQEELLVTQGDNLRRIEALYSEYEAQGDFGQLLRDDDGGKYAEMQKLYKVLALKYGTYVRQRLAEHLATPATTSALAEENNGVAMLERLNRELQALEQTLDAPTPAFAEATPDALPAAQGEATAPALAQAAPDAPPDAEAEPDATAEAPEATADLAEPAAQESAPEADTVAA